MSIDNKDQIIQLLQEIKKEFLLTFKREDVVDFVFKNTEQMIRNSELEGLGLFGLDNHPFGSNSNKNDAITIMSKMAILKEYLNKYLSLLLSISNNPASFNEFQILVSTVDINKLDGSIENESIPLKWKNKLSESLNFIKNRLGYNMSIKDINQDYYKSIFKFISKQLKLEFFYDTTDDHNLYTFSEHQFVLDIKFTKVGVSVDIIDHPNQELKKDVIENVLLKNIKINDMEQFRNNLEFITKLNSKYLKNQNINLFHLIDVMNKDIDFLFNNENDGDCNRLFDFGHGIPLKFHNVIGPTIIFWTNSININKTEDVIELFKKGDKDINKQFIMGDLNIEESGMHSLVLPNTILKYIYLEEENIQLNEGNQNIFNIMPHTYPLINQPIKMLYFDPNNTELAHQLSIPLKWYFNLKQPILICQQLIIKISIIVGQLLTNEFLFLFDPQPIPDLCEVLINESIQKQEFIEPFNVNNNIDINNSPWIAVSIELYYIIYYILYIIYYILYLYKYYFE
ncbi:hypothetical protein K502DRAFT_264106 [Neoconidiobolus thromboides FSU 785]|nr:hypothetical protein K502DRAFT_264106 [Neoconidiobolus thromboides FSU 785]